MKTAFIGHRYLFTDIRDRLTSAVIAEIENGCKLFTMGTHGEFDALALYICKRLREVYKDISIEVNITSLNAIKSENGCETPYSDVDTVMYEIECIHFRQSP